MFSAGIPAFLANLALAGWIKFRDAPATAMAITVIMGVSVLVFLITYGLWGSHLIGKDVDLFKGSLPYSPTGLPFDWHLIPSRNKLRQVPSSQGRASPYLSTSLAPRGSADDLVVEPLQSVMEGESEHGASQSPGTDGGVHTRSHGGHAVIDEEAGVRSSGTGLHNQRLMLRSGASGNSARSSQKRPLQRLSSAELILGEFRRSTAASTVSAPETATTLRSLPSRVYSSVSHTLFGASSTPLPDPNV